MTRARTTVITVLTVGVLFFAYLNTQRYSVRLDLTADRSFTLSAAARNLSSEVTDRVFVTYYRTEGLSRSQPGPREIEDFLRSLESVSQGRLHVSFEDPQKTGKIAAVERLGLQPQSFRSVAGDQARIDTVYSGIVVEYLGRVAVLPAVSSTASLEYDLLSRIRTLIRGSQRTIGVMVAASNATWEGFGALAGALSTAGFSVANLSPGAEIPASLSAVFVFGGARELDDWSLYRIEVYLRGGGSVLFAVDGVTVDTDKALAATPVLDSKLFAFLTSYGVRVAPQLVLDPSSLTIPYQKKALDGSTQVLFVKYPHWVSVLPENLSPTHPVTAGASGIDLFWPSPLELLQVPGVTGEVIARSTSGSWRMDRDFVTAPDAGEGVYTPRGRVPGSEALAVSLSGAFPGYFPSLPRPLRPGAVDQLPPLPKSPRPARILVVGDADFAGPLVQYTGSSRNLDFAVAAGDWLSRDDDLAGIRNRIPHQARLDRITDVDQRARAAEGARVINVLLVPSAVLLIALARVLSRRKDRRRDLPK